MASLVENPTIAARLAASPGWAMANQAGRNINALRQGQPMGQSPVQAWQQHVANRAIQQQRDLTLEQSAQRLNPFFEYEEAVKRGYAVKPDGSDMSFPEWQQLQYRRRGPTSVQQNFQSWMALNPQMPGETEEQYQKRMQTAFDRMVRAPSQYDLGGGGVGQTAPLGGDPTVLVSPQEATDREAGLTAAREFAKNQESWRNNESKLIGSIASAKTKAQTVTDTIEDIMPVLDDWTTGYGSMLSALPDTEARRLRNFLDTIRANVAFTTLQDMRANSPTGGALGQVSERELDLLMSALGSLDQAGTVEDLKTVLRRIERNNWGTLDRLEQAYEMDRKKYRPGDMDDEEDDDPEVNIPGL